MLWNPEDLNLVAKFTPDSGPTNNVTFNVRKTKCLYVSSGCNIFEFDIRNLSECTRAFRDVHGDEVNEMVTDDKGQYLLSCDDDGMVYCLDISKEEFRVSSKHQCHDNICSTVQWVPGRTAEVISGGMDCKIVHRDVYKPYAINTITEPTNQEGAHIINPPFVNSVSTHWKSRYMVAGYASGKVGVWRLGSRKVGYTFVKSLPPHLNGTGCVRMLDGNIVASGGNDSFININLIELPSNSEHLNGSFEYDTKASVISRLLHGRKINWLCGEQCSDKELALFVADETSTITKYMYQS